MKLPCAKDLEVGRRQLLSRGDCRAWVRGWRKEISNSDPTFHPSTERLPQGQAPPRPPQGSQDSSSSAASDLQLLKDQEA